MFPWKVSEIIDDQKSSAFIIHVSHNVSDEDGSALIELKILQINTHMIRNGSVNLK